MKRKLITVVVCMLMCATVASVAGTVKTESKAFNAATETSNGITWIQANNAIKETSTRSVDWIHYDDGTCENSLGLTAGGTLHEIIKLTPTELAGHTGSIISIKVMHGCPLYPGTPATPYTAWIYTNANHPSGDPTAVATIVGTGTCPAIDNWYYINFSGYAFNDTDTIWVGVGWTHPAGTFPCGFDTGSCISGKSDWLWYTGGWYELGGIGYPGNWNLWVGVGTGSTNNPPVTPGAPTGPSTGVTGVSYSFGATTTDPESDNISFMFDWGDGNMSTWLGPYPSGGTVLAPYAWAHAGSYDVKVKAKDEHGAESGWSPAHSIVISAGPTIEIGTISGGLLKVKAQIKNTGGAAATNVSWKIELTGGLILLGKSTSGKIASLGSGETNTVSSKMIVGFGKTKVTVTADTVTKSVNASVMLIYIKI